MSDESFESKIEENDPRMYILVNKNLAMGKGKIASQTAHAVQLIVHRIITNMIRSPSVETTSDYLKYIEWMELGGNTGGKTIVLNVPYEEMINFLDEKKNKCVCIMDGGLTQVAPGSLTVIGFYPTDNVNFDVKKFKLL